MPPIDEEEGRLALELELELERWTAAQPAPPTLWDVVETGDPRLIAAWITPVFRRAVAQAGEKTARVERVRGVLRAA